MLTFTHFALIACINEIRFQEAHQQGKSGMWDETAETIDDVDATRVDTGQINEREVKRRSATTRLVQAHMSSETVSLSSRLNVADLQLEMQRFW